MGDISGPDVVVVGCPDDAVTDVDGVRDGGTLHIAMYNRVYAIVDEYIYTYIYIYIYIYVPRKFLIYVILKLRRTN